MNKTRLVSINTKLQQLVCILLFLSISTFLNSQTLFKGTVKDEKTNESLPGVSISLKNTTAGTITNIDGNYQLEVSPGTYTLLASYISYNSVEYVDIEIKKGETKYLHFTLSEAIEDLGEVLVVARKNREGERILTLERQNSTIAVENIGVKEMSIKGLSTVADGIKKITGISMEGNSKVFVRGLADRYSMTSLNGFPIASPNPDNKLIPLTLFPTTVVKNVTVSKVYEPSVFGDYSGAHINVETKENIGADFFTFGVSTGGRTNVLFRDFYSSDKGGIGVPYLGISGGLKLSQKIKDMNPDDFIDYTRQENPFKTSFSIEKSTALPELSLEIGAGKSWKVGRQKLNAMIAANFNNDYVLYEDAYTSLVNAQGVIRERFNYNEYLYETTLTTLGQISYSLRDNDMLSYNIMYVNNTEDIYRKRDGMDAEGKELMGSNSIYHIYSLLNNQLTGKHEFLGRLFTDWQFSYGRTTSDEPDRRQVMFEKNNDGSLSLFKLNQQETMRYFGELFEDEWNGEIKAKYNLNKSDTPDFIRLGISLRDKSRDFYSANFYYDVKTIYPVVTDIYDTDSYLNSENLMNSSITIDKNSQRRNKYYADAKITAGFIDFEYYPIKNLLIAGGVRYEHSKQSVDYWADAGNPEKAKLDANDFFPALSLKYTLNGSRNLRLSVSRTITRPSFLEMAPFEYQELYGGITSRGFSGIMNGYNTNIDLRYEYFNKEGDLFSIGAYYKQLKDAIENILVYSGSLIQSYRNADKGIAAGVELELRKKLTKELKVDFNASYIYTHISLPEGGTYTDRSRALQGASPYLINLDVNYAPQFGKKRVGSFSLVYNVQGPRISSVGINGVNNVMEETFHSLDFVGTYSLNSRVKLKFQAKNLINQKQKFSQKVADTGKKETVEYYKKGLSLGIGFSMDF